MPLNFITHNNNHYPEHQAIGGASLWIRPLAQYYCKGTGLDIGYSKECWMLPNAIGIEPAIDPTYNAMRLPTLTGNDKIVASETSKYELSGGGWDFIHSSHCLEHVKENWCNVLDYWLSKIKIGGILFLYLPHKSQSYWNVTSNRKHIHEFDGSEIGKYLNHLGHDVYVSGCDFNNSFVVICEKRF